MKDLYALFRQSLAGLRLMIAATLVLGLAYPAVVYGFGRVAAPWQARGSLVTADGSHTTDPKKAVGSASIGQLVDDPDLFQPRPSAAGDGYDMLSTSGSNLGPEEPALIEAIKERKAEIAEREGVPRERRTAGRGHRVRLGTGPRHLGGVRRAAGAAGRGGQRAERGRRARPGRGPHLGPHLGRARRAARQRPDAQHRRPEAAQSGG